MDVWPALNRACHSNTHVRLTLSSPNACVIIAKVSVALFPRFAQNLMPFLCRIHREIASSQMHDSKYKYVKKSAHHPAAWNYVHWLPRYASTFMYCCIAPLQLLYRWQHQSLKLWIPPRMSAVTFIEYCFIVNMGELVFLQWIEALMKWWLCRSISRNFSSLYNFGI
jgi:hypothetical protein